LPQILNPSDFKRLVEQPWPELQSNLTARSTIFGEFLRKNQKKPKKQVEKQATS
jgi:hypothetical protein